MRQKNRPRRKAAGEAAKDTAGCRCPLCELMGVFERSGCECFEVFKQTRIEFLKAIRTLIDRRVEVLEKGGPKRGKGGRIRRIEVED